MARLWSFPAAASPLPGAAAFSSPAGAGGGGAAAGLVNCGIKRRGEIALAKNALLSHAFDECPVIGFRVLKNDVLTVRKARNPDELAARLEGAERGEIIEFSRESRRRLALVAGNCDVLFRSLVTLTYPREFPADGLLVKAHWAAIRSALMRWTDRASYLWFLEFQKRGAPHIHVFLSAEMPAPLSEMSRRGGRVRKSCLTHWPWQDWLSRRWFEIVGSGDEKHLRAGAAWEVIEKPDGAARYVSKEAHKCFQKIVPQGFRNVGRFWGCSRDVSGSVGEGQFIPATPAAMAKIFPSAAFDPDGDPWAVIFGGADSVRDALAAGADPRAPKSRLGKWKAKFPTGELISGGRGRKQKHVHETY